MARHARWRRDANLTLTDAGVSEHDLCMRILEAGSRFDQLNVGELASFELVCRRAQLVELKYKHKTAGSGYGDEEFLYMGLSETRGFTMIAPSLEEFVSGQMAKEGAVLKEKRKLREEKLLNRRQKPPKGKGKDKGGEAAVDGS